MKTENSNIARERTDIMIHSDRHKKLLCGWVQDNCPEIFNSSLRLQKFLFFYECFSKIKGLSYSFSHLRGYEKGPVFSDVYGDYTKEHEDFKGEIMRILWSIKPEELNHEILTQSAFLCSTVTEETLSALTHKMNIWKAKENEIRSGEKQVSLNEKDFSKEDKDLINQLWRLCPIKDMKEVYIINEKDKYFVFKAEEKNLLTNEHRNALKELVEKCPDELYNPVYVEIDKEDGGLNID